jgi:hypothetical protein
VTPDRDPNDTQLVLLDELTTCLRQAGIAHWLFGGWAVDFLVGTITRPHGDIDLVIWRDDGPAVRALLAPHGYVEAPPPPEESALHTHFSKEGQPIDAMFIHREEDGGIYWSSWRWPDGSFAERVCQLGAVVSPVVSAGTLLAAKEAYLRESPDQPDWDKCRLDIDRLRLLLPDR